MKKEYFLASERGKLGVNSHLHSGSEVTEILWILIGEENDMKEFRITWYKLESCCSSKEKPLARVEAFQDSWAIIPFIQEILTPLTDLKPTPSEITLKLEKIGFEKSKSNE